MGRAKRICKGYLDGVQGTILIWVYQCAVEKAEAGATFPSLKGLPPGASQKHSGRGLNRWMPFDATRTVRVDALEQHRERLAPLKKQPA